MGSTWEVVSDRVGQDQRLRGEVLVAESGFRPIVLRHLLDIEEILQNTEKRDQGDRKVDRMKKGVRSTFAREYGKGQEKDTRAGKPMDPQEDGVLGIPSPEERDQAP